MNLVWLFCAFLMNFGKCQSIKMIANFVKNYYADRIIREIVIFDCWDSYEKIKFARDVMELDTKISFAPMTKNLELNRILKVNYYHIGVVFDIDCPQRQIILQQLFRNELPFNESYNWLLLTEETTTPVKMLSQLPLTVESEVTLAIRKNNQSFVLYDVYNLSYRHNGSLNVTFKGFWTPQQGIKNELTDYKYIRRGNFHGLTLNISYLLSNPAVPNFETYMSTPINPHLDTMIRYHYALILQLRDIYNFTINLRRSETWGYLVNGTWNGVVADMIAGFVDISAAPFQWKRERIDFCEYTVETYVVRPLFFFRHPKKNDVRNPFLKPFVPSVWYVIAIVALIYWIFLYVSTKVEEHFRTAAPVNSLDTHPASETGLIVIASISQQGLSDGPRIIAGRIVFLSLFMWGLLLYQFYSASIVGSLLAEQTRFITTTKALMDSNIDVYFENISYYEDYFATNTDPLVLEFYDKKVKPTKKRPKGSYTSIENGFNLVKKGGYAFHIDVAAGYKIIPEVFTDDEKCDLQEIALMAPKNVAIPTSKKSPFKKMITYGLRRIVESGLNHGLRQVWLSPRPKCPESHSSTPVPVQVEEFSPALFLLLMGSAFATLVMLLENCCKRRNCWLKNFSEKSSKFSISNENFENNFSPKKSIISESIP